MSTIERSRSGYSVRGQLNLDVGIEARVSDGRDTRVEQKMRLCAAHAFDGAADHQSGSERRLRGRVREGERARYKARSLASISRCCCSGLRVPR